MGNFANGEDKIASFVPLDLVTGCNTTDDEIFAHVRANSRRQLPWVRSEAPPHNGVAVLVGGGPSLAETVEDIRAHSATGHTIFALNGAEKWLREREICVNAQVLLDPRESNVKFVNESTAQAFYLGSQCHPALFDALEGKSVTLYHTGDEGIDEQYEGPNAIGICGGITVGLSAMSLVYALGYRELHLFGYDSSDRFGIAHAYPQAEVGAERERMEVWVAGKTYWGQPALIAQATKFPKWAMTMMRGGVSLHVHGDGLLPAIAREMQKEVEPDAACYDLAISPSSWDFAVWLITAEMNKRRLGCDKPLRVAFMAGPEQGFRRDNLPGASVRGKQQMLGNVVKPLLPLIGAVEDQSAYAGFSSHCYVLKPVVDAARNGEEVPKFRPSEADLTWIDNWLGEEIVFSKPPRAIAVAPVTITLREADYWPMRNSDLGAWEEFALRRRAEGETIVFIRDTAKADVAMPFHSCPRASREVGIRAALYHRAKVNLFVSNGPMMLAVFGDRPFLIFNELVPGSCANAEQWRDLNGLEVGEQYPWATPLQRLTWSRDTIENIEAAWQKLIADMKLPLAAE